MSSILQFIAPFAVSILSAWLKTKDKENKMTQSFYDFLRVVDSAGTLKVANHIAAEDALKLKQEELKNQLKGKQQ